MAVTQQRLTIEQFLKLPEKEPALEFEDGLVSQKLSPKGQHSRLQWKLSELVNRFAEPRKLAVAFPELRATFGGRSYVPDVAVYRWERIPRTPAGEVANDFTEPPDIAMEVVSPAQSVNALLRRCLWYVAHGVQLAVLVDPGDRSAIVFRPDTRSSAFQGADRIDFTDILHDFQFSVDDLFESLGMQ
jgi:Uma2 family endonuclease